MFIEGPTGGPTPLRGGVCHPNPTKWNSTGAFGSIPKQRIENFIQCLTCMDLITNLKRHAKEKTHKPLGHPTQ